MLYKLHNTENGIMLAVCDKELLGLKLENDFMDIEVHTAMYGGEKFSTTILDKHEIKIINAIGKKSVGALKESGLIGSNELVFIGKHPYFHYEL